MVLSRHACIVLAIIAQLLIGCTKSETAVEKPTHFLMGRSISLGPYTITVSHTEVSAAKGKYKIAVFFDWAGLPDLDVLNITMIQRERGTMFKLMDDAGHKYPADTITTADAYHGWERSGGESLLKEMISPSKVRQWVVIFEVPLDTQGHTLLLENPDQREGQPRFAAVSLK